MDSKTYEGPWQRVELTGPYGVHMGWAYYSPDGWTVRCEPATRFLDVADLPAKLGGLA